MLEAIAVLLLAFQVAVFIYFLVLNLGYTMVTSYAFREVEAGASAVGDLDTLRRRMRDA